MATPLRLNFMFSCFGKLFVAGVEAKGILKVFTHNEAKIIKIKVGVIGKLIFPRDENCNSNAVDHIFYCSEEHIFTAADIEPEQDDQLLEYTVPLANNLPPSISLDEGSIEYHLYATMEEEFLDGATQVVNTQANISVATLVDCNIIPKANKDKFSNQTSVSTCICIRNEDTASSLKISPRAYVPGDCVKVNAVVYNSTNTSWTYVQVALVQKVKLKHEDRVVRVERIVSETKRGHLMPQRHQFWRDEYLRIPPIAPSTYHKNITITYKLKLIPGIQSKTSSLASATILSIPVFIGNLPLENTIAHFNELPQCESFGNKVLPIPAPYDEFARAENCILTTKQSKFVPAYISYSTERAMETVDLSQMQD